MRRTILVLAACGAISLTGASAAQAASVTAGGGGGAARAAGPKATHYHLNVYNGSFEKYNEATVLIYNRTKTWEDPPYCDYGTFSKVGKTLTLNDECGPQTWKFEKVKPPAKNTYFGVAESGGSFIAYLELIKE